MTQAYPLHWPEGWPRTQSRQSSRFDTTLSKAIGNVEDALRLFANDSGRKVEAMLVSSNFTLTDRSPKDSGVAVYFTWDGISICIAVDRYSKIEENLQAIYHCVEAERTKLRHGGLNLVRAAFRGYAALPPPATPKARHWSTVIGIDSTRPLAEVEAAYKTRARAVHPDNGGSSDLMAELNIAIAQARKEKH